MKNSNNEVTIELTLHIRWSSGVNKIVSCTEIKEEDILHYGIDYFMG